MLIPGQKLNPRRLLKREMLFLMTNYCRHGHTFAAHPNCYFEEKVWEKDPNAPGVEKVGFLDIESTGLKANWDHMICYCIKELDGGILERSVTPKEIRNFIFDQNVVKQLCKDIRKFDRIVVHFGTDRKFDIPFIRSRALYWQATMREQGKSGTEFDFPLYKEIRVTDTYTMARAKLCLHRNRLETICQHLKIPAKGHRLEPDIWQKARSGSKESIHWILEHCREDVISLEAVWKELIPFVRNANTSI